MSLALIPMIAGLPGWEPPDKSAPVSEWVAYDLDITEALVNLDGISAGEVRQMLVKAQSYLMGLPVADDDDGQRAARLGELEREIGKLSAYDQRAASPRDLWPAERRAIERAYQWADANGAALSLDADQAKARADVLNRMLGNAGDAAGFFGQGLERTLQQAVKWLAIGAIVIGAVTVLPGVLSGLGSVRRARR